MKISNPLNRSVTVKACHQTTPDLLNAYKVPVDISIPSAEP